MRSLKRFCADRRGLAATEAALLAPILIFCGIASVDLGLAGTKRLELDQGLRAGAQVSMVNVTDEQQILEATLAALGESEAGGVQADGLCAAGKTCVSVAYACRCAGGTPSPCDALCIPSGDIPSAFLTIAASRRHEAMLFPDMNLASQITVQTR